MSVASWCHHREAQNHSPEHFHSPFLAGGMNAESLTIFKRHLKTHLFRHHLTSSYKKKKKLNSFLTFALFPLTSHCLARICSEHCLEICITSTSCVCWLLYNVLLIVFLNCKSLWIKASAKWINVNANIFTSLHTYSHRHTYKCFGNVCFPWRSSRKTSNSPKKIIDGFGGVVCLSLENACMSRTHLRFEKSSTTVPLLAKSGFFWNTGLLDCRVLGRTMLHPSVH